MDSKWSEIFEKYLNNRLEEKERLELEEALAADEDLKASFLIYQSIEEDLGKSIKNQSKESDLKKSLIEASKNYSEQPMQVSYKKPRKIGSLIALIGTVAASLLLIFFVYQNFFDKEPNLQQIAQNYFDAELERIGQTMGPGQDSLQMGIAFYNQKEYTKAALIFEDLVLSDPANSEAIKNLGLSYLGQKDYEGALVQFERLSQMQQLYANPGPFYTAMTLLIRNEEEDIDKAKSLLQKVIEEDQEGSRIAKEWLERF